MPYPGNKVHRRGRRHAGRGQGPFPPNITTAVTGSGSTVTLTFSSPVIVTGSIPITVATLTIVSQTVVNSTTVTITMSGTVATHAWSLPSPIPNVVSYQGGPATGGAGTF